MRNGLKGAEHHRAALQEPSRARRQRAAVFRADQAGPNRRSPNGNIVPDVAQDRGLKFRHDVQGDDLPTDLVPQKSSRSLGIFKEQDHRQCDDENSRVLRTGFFSPRDKQPNFATMKLALGLDVQTNAKGGKFMSVDPSRCCGSPATSRTMGPRKSERCCWRSAACSSPPSSLSRRDRPRSLRCWSR